MLTMIPMHIGSDHPLAMALTLVLAFGPFIGLGIVVVIIRRRDADEDPVTPASGDQSDSQP